MRKSSIILMAAVLAGPFPVTARVPGPIIECPGNGGTTRPPFYSVRAVQNVKRLGPIRVTGTYMLNLRSNRLMLVEARPQGSNPTILLLRLKMIPDATAGGRCLGFGGRFPPRKIYRVQITDWRGHSVSAPVRRIR